jgi:hypothetical protein
LRRSPGPDGSGALLLLTALAPSERHARERGCRHKPLLAEAIGTEAEAFLAAMKEERLPDGARFVYHDPKRTVQSGIKPVPVKRAKLATAVPMILMG